MNSKKIVTYCILVILGFFIWFFSNSNAKNEEFDEIVKISMRSVGHQLLISNRDSTSLILPITGLENFKYQLLFQEQLSFEPGNLVAIIKHSFKKASLPKNYRVEVKQCTNQEVAYSYDVNDNEAYSIIPCKGRFLPKSCYAIVVRFTNQDSFLGKQIYLYLFLFIAFVFFEFFFFKEKPIVAIDETDLNHTAIGSFLFFPEQNKLVFDATDIRLSKKECELLEIFIAKPNQIIKREEFVKKVWEDNGVFVGRSLDTYISKLRKKLKADTSIRLTNIHGIGYKLEFF